ncbi:HigA family addiction module antitoxin [uncultured Mucilaginibacter sp.]|uniref:HigA family addiction module antitoxin n=1 Tax=uncultured Mucilaginibacter sp. TaxID=797541 RepID=UPI00263356B0|nr:HigA family addiction module antitoxin [uncultured Mucilaginibacter sp.]
MGNDKIIDNQGNEIILDIELHPGEILKNELEARKITKSAFAMKIGMYPGHFGDIVKGKRNITASIAVKLETELGIAAEFWMALQTDYDLHLERNKLKHSA